MAAAERRVAPAPEADKWYPLQFGSSFLHEEGSSRLYTFRYEFKPASIDMEHFGCLRKNPESKVSLELPNNQPGKPPVEFVGHLDQCKDQDGVFLFDGQRFRLERLHRAVRNLRHVRSKKEEHHGQKAEMKRSPLPAREEGAAARGTAGHAHTPSHTPPNVPSPQMGPENDSARPKKKPGRGTTEGSQKGKKSERAHAKGIKGNARDHDDRHDNGRDDEDNDGAGERKRKRPEASPLPRKGVEEVAAVIKSPPRSSIFAGDEIEEIELVGEEVVYEEIEEEMMEVDVDEGGNEAPGERTKEDDKRSDEHDSHDSSGSDASDDGSSSSEDSGSDDEGDDEDESASSGDDI